MQIILVSCILALAGAAGCLGSGGTSTAGSITGILLMTGNEPFVDLSLQTMNGRVFVIQRDSTALYSELRRLQGAKVAVRYRLSSARRDSSMIIIERYEIVTDR